VDPLRDAHGRRIRDVRVSVTDRCNFRCQYCMPADGLPWLEREEILSFEEVHRVVRLLKGEIDQRFSQVPSRVGNIRVGSIQLWKEQEWKLHFGETGRMELPTGTELGVRPDGVRGRTLRTKVDVPGVVSTKVRLQNHAPVMVGPVPHGDGYLFIRVEPEFTDHLVAEPAPNPAVQGTVPVNQER
jgi:hypothetical protein